MSRQLTQKSRSRAAFVEHEGLFQAGHFLDGRFQIGVGAIGTGTFWRHGIDTRDRFGEQTVNTAVLFGALAPGGSITHFRRAQQAGAVASVAVFCNHGIRSFGITAAYRRNDFHAFALLTSHANLADGRKAAARMVGTDPETDLAVIRISERNLPVMVLGQPDDARVGDVVLAIGNPFGVGQTVTMGIISALGRNNLHINHFENFIQTDAAINFGNSGGALVDTNGHLLGINSAIYSQSGGSVGIGFAIPVSTAKSVLDAIVKNGEVVRGWIGIESQDITPEMVESFGLSKRSGAMIAGVVRGGPAERAGIQPGDILVAVAGKKVADTSEMLKLVAQLEPGASVPMTIVRQGRETAIAVKVGRRPRQTP